MTTKNSRIILKKSVVAGKVPVPTDLEIGEIAVNLTDKKIYTKDSSNNIVLIASPDILDGNGSSELDKKVSKAGDTMTGQLILPGGGTGNEAATVAEIQQVVTDFGFKGVYDTTQTYKIDDVVINGTTLYKANQQTIVGTFTPAHWDRLSYGLPTDAPGVLNNDGAGGLTWIRTTTTGGAPADAGLIPVLDAGGRLPAAMVPFATTGAMEFKGLWTPSAAIEYPQMPLVGDMYIIEGPDYTFAAGDLVGQTAKIGDMIIYETAGGWHRVSQHDSLAAAGVITEAQADVRYIMGNPPSTKTQSITTPDPNKIILTLNPDPGQAVDMFRVGTTYAIDKDGNVRCQGGVFNGPVTLAGAPTAATEAATKGYVDNYSYSKADANARYLLLSGGSLTNFLTLHADPTNAMHPATKQYVDARSYTKGEADNRYLRTIGGALTGYTTVHADPVSNMQIANKAYVDAYSYSKSASDGRYLKTTGGTSSGTINAPTFMQAGKSVLDVSSIGGTVAPLSHNHTAAQITSGRFNVARLGAGTANTGTYLRGDGNWVAPPFSPTNHKHSAADITSGRFPPARVGGGTPTSSKFLRGDGNWAAVPTSAPPSYNGVGSFVFAGKPAGGHITPNQQYPGSQLTWASAMYNTNYKSSYVAYNGGSLGVGTWVCLGQFSSGNADTRMKPCTVFRRIA